MKVTNDKDVKDLLKRTNKLLVTIIVLMSIFLVNYGWASYQARYQTWVGFKATVQTLGDIDSVIRQMRVY